VTKTVNIFKCRMYFSQMQFSSPREKRFSYESFETFFYLWKLFSFSSIWKRFSFKHERNQILTTNGWLDLKWNDYHWKWNKTKYGNLTRTRIPYEQWVIF